MKKRAPKGSPLDSKSCRQCGKVMLRRDYDSFNRRHFCSAECMHAAKKFTPEQIVAAFWAKVDKSGECWLWTSWRQPDGYGQFRVNGKFANSHKFSYELAYGPVTKGLEVKHSCHVRHCVNPEHLSLGTHAENVAETVALKRHAWGERVRKNKLTADQVREILAVPEPRPRGLAGQLASRYGVNRGVVAAIWRGTSWKNLRSDLE